MESIAVLVSGGVDSSVVLHKLHSQGLKVYPYYLKIWLEDELSYLGSCPWEEDLKYAKALCHQLGLDLEIVSMQSAYWEAVVSYTIDEIKQGRTPNPDMLCNREVKLGAFLHYVDKKHKFIATGHYARRIETAEGMKLALTNDEIKDQTYFLAQVPYHALKCALFPLGDMTKAEARQYACQNSIPSAQRPDSQGVCFLGKIKFKEFVKHHLGVSVGNIYEYETGRLLGKHEGYWFYTIGQRQGIGLSGGPWYVVLKNVIENSIFVSNLYYNSDKDRKDFTVHSLNILSGDSIESGTYRVKIRHGKALQNASVLKINSQQLHVSLEHNDQGIAAGQFAVFYDDEGICLGSGVIL